MSENGISVGIRDKETDELVAVYPEAVQKVNSDVKKKVLDWYYMQDCSTSENIEKYYVDALTEKEIKEHM